MESEGDGVLGRLPNSRPGTRSGKRDSPARGTRRAAPQKAKAAPRKATATPRKAAAPKKAAPKRTAAPEPPARPAPAPSGGDPLTGAVRAATRVAETGLKVAGGVTREVLRRLPRP